MDVALNTYSVRNEWDQLAKKGLDKIVAICNDMGVTQLEWLDRHFEKEELAKGTKHLADCGIKVFAIGPHVHLLAKPAEVNKMVADGKEWLELAHGAGVGHVRFQVGDGPLPRAFAPPPDDADQEDKDEYGGMIGEAVELSAKVIDPLLVEAEKLGVNIAIETHHSYSSNYVYMKLVNERWPSKNIGWIFDIGNYPTDEERWTSLDVIKKRTYYVHAKAYDFDGNGFEKKLDYPKACKVLHDAGFDGNWSIEFEGKMNGILGAFRTSELVRYSIAAAQGKAYTMRTSFPSEKDLIGKYKQ
ncbi:MAG: sugar phosphate isomerase/epimerase [Candidatus Lokiarchaeota archaeon]|nr:sugar phosphate isomerase/epimerase [Candidatus Lokiarchaeota archaeon]